MGTSKTMVRDLHGTAPGGKDHDGTYRGRFAPSPTGPLHFGSLVTALGSWLLARHVGGTWLVRIEDLDPPRAIRGASELQLHTLARFGMTSDEPILRQSPRDAYYQAALDDLLARNLAFPCHCSRSDLSAHAGIHRRCMDQTSAHGANMHFANMRPASMRSTSPQQAQPRDPAIRFRVPDFTTLAFDDVIQGRTTQDVAGEVGDFVLQRADGLWAYQLAVVVDDAAQGITQVVRGADLLDSTPRQILLQRALGLPTTHYAHLPLVVDGSGHKLSKSLGALPLDDIDPLLALKMAWAALEQVSTALDGNGPVDALLQQAVREFDPTLIPRLPRRAPGQMDDTVVTADV